MSEHPTEIMNAIDMLATAKLMESEVVKSLKSKASELLMPYMKASGLKSLPSDPHRGTVNYSPPTTSNKFDKSQAKIELLNRGVSANVIQQAFEAATSPSPRAGYVSFKLHTE